MQLSEQNTSKKQQLVVKLLPVTHSYVASTYVNVLPLHAV